MPDEFKALMRDLDTDVRDLARKYRRSLVERVLLWLILAAMVVFGVLYYVQQSAQHDYTTQQIRELACVIIAPNPDTIPVVKAKRSEYHCPPYDPKVAKQYQPTATPAPTRTVARKVPVPGPTSTVTATRAVPGPGGTRTFTRTVPGPASTRTVTRTVTVTRTAKPPICVPGLCK